MQGKEVDFNRDEESEETKYAEDKEES